MNTKRTPPEQRFWSHVVITDDCWFYNGPEKSHRYQKFYDGTRLVFAYRFSYTLANGPIPDGMEVCHACDIPACVRLEQGAQVTELARRYNVSVPTMCEALKGRTWKHVDSVMIQAAPL